MTRLDEYATIIAACSLPTIKKKLFERNDKKEEAERNRTSVPELALLPPNPDYSVQISCVCVVCFVCGASENTILDPATASAFIMSACAVPRSMLSCLIWLYSLVF